MWKRCGGMGIKPRIIGQLFRDMHNKFNIDLHEVCVYV